MKKLRKKIFWSIELSATGVLFLILFFFNLIRYFQYEQKEWQMLSSVIESAEDNLLFNQPFSSDLPSDSRDNISNLLNERFSDNKGFFKSGKGARHKNRETAEIINNLVSGEISLLQLSSSGEISNFSGFIEEYTEEERSELAKYLFKKTKTTGHYHGMKFLYKNFDSYKLIAILDSGYINMDVITLAFASLFGLLVAGALFALLAKKISGTIARPVEETLLTQKQFIADASHELKTPVSVMLANISVLEKEFGNNRFMDYLKEEGKRMAALINSLLMLSKLDYDEEENVTKKNMISFNLSDTLLETALPFESLAFEMGLHYLIQIPDNIMAYGIPEDIKQIAGILLDNAFKYSDEHGTVIINLEEVIQKKNLRASKHAVLQIKNTGTPIPPDILPKIFHRFYKADSSRAYNENSFGLGLSIAKSLVEKNGGNITVESDHSFTIFTVYL